MLRAEGGTRTRTPFVGTRLSTWRVYRSTTSALTVGWADQSLLGVPTPATAGTSGGYAPAQEAREPVTEQPGAEGETCTRTPRRAPASEAGMSAFHHFRLRPSRRPRASPGCRPPDPAVQRPGARRGGRHRCRRGELHPHALDGAPGFGPGVSAFHHVGRPTAGGSTLVVVVPRTGIEPVISSLRGRRVGHSTNGALQAGAGLPVPQGGPARPGWSLSGSNRPPPLCKRGALPDELRPQGRTGPPGDGAAQRSGRWWRARVPPPAPWGY